ncbi:hypothetical protein RF11_13678 [Thelohanellus kitauei]|uniref:Uncharacterized protein n=1 Tax=Thelohanellus kitauei TaxID=669202 RepID=A0A0C2MD47_THEKT|nr:hypothetical protein RF11_13678 [Thelohanellus kitauei]
MIEPRTRLPFLIALFVFSFYAQKNVDVDDVALNVVVIGDFGVMLSQSAVKQNVIRTIQLQNQDRPFQLGINLGGNQYPHGSQRGDVSKLIWMFGASFPSSMFQFDFLTVLGEVDHQGDIRTQIQYSVVEERFYMPHPNYHYGLCKYDQDVKLVDNTRIRFVCIDSMPLYYPKPGNRFDA